MRLQQKNKRYICIIPFLFISNIYAFDAICDPSENILFSCTMKNNKYLSICSITEHNQSLVSYKYGTPNKTELVFPTMKQNNNLFKYNHYARYQTDYFRLVFINNNYEYEVYRNYDGETSDEVSAGVNILNLRTKKAFNNQCKSIKIDKINQLSTILKCDIDNALGCELAE